MGRHFGASFFYLCSQVDMKLRDHTIIQLMLLCLVISLVYIPAFQADPCLLDDASLLKKLQSEAHPELTSIISPNPAQSAYYQRPLVAVSYWCSQMFWNANAQAMHTENIVFHMLNAFLLFLLIRLLIQNDKHSDNFFPLLGSLLFAIHPITTESVNWISGRSDLIACAFLISTAISIITWRRRRSNWWLLLVAMLLLAGAIMSKETAWGFLVIVPFYLEDSHNSQHYNLGELFRTFSRIGKLCLLTIIALCFFLAAHMLSFWPVIILSSILGLIVAYHKYRRHLQSKRILIFAISILITSSVLIPSGIKLAQRSYSDAIQTNFSRTILLISLDFDNSIALFSAALAFYIKKFFLPLPLSFSITNIAPWYLFAGIAVIIITAILSAWHSQAAILFLTGIALLLPALPLVFDQIAWTPYAERYMYISSGFWIAAMMVGISSLKHPSLYRTLCLTLCLVLIPTFATITYIRSTIWQTNVALFSDTARKSPGHIETQILYMHALTLADHLLEALEQYRRIQKDPRIRVEYINELADRLNHRGFKREALYVLETSLSRPLPLGQRHPLNYEGWQKLYQFHKLLGMELLNN